MINPNCPIHGTPQRLRTQQAAPTPPPLAPRPLRPAQPWCRTCWRDQDDCHCAPSLDGPLGSLRLNSAAPQPRPVPVPVCRHCGHARCRCAVAPAPDTLTLVIEAQRARGQR